MRTTTITLERAILPLIGVDHIQQLCEDAIKAIDDWKKQQTDRNGQIFKRGSTSIDVTLSWLEIDEHADKELHEWFTRYHIKVK